ncbi:ankyrin repeat and SAM domain-containing protein 6 isoform X2 [Phoenix dactylifera]|uniref:Ankyrin repeat and SAM domain-containing protein 6 isoform X2 n=1 Tax=Phoenix dactylifera TaxID=42345 RepID=A0A8B7C9Q4_PHODC|nr:ankyrin repeat and SAM domain-containing protein 6 isoform X2 [Phoenix dactylifera]
MYADREASGTKRSIQERLNGGLADDVGRTRYATGKRQRQTDDRWKHDLYKDDEGPQVSNLRLKLQKKDMQQVYQGGKRSGVRDLREKLSGTMNPLPTSTHLPKPKPVSEIVKPVQKTDAAEATVLDTKKVPAPASSKKQSKQKSELSVDSLLRSLGLEKYSITFQAEEVDMTALMHMTDADLKALGIPMGPRKKILLALDSRD